MSVALFTHPACLEHVEPPSHAERRDRLHAVIEALNEKDFPDLVRIKAPRAAREDVRRVHTSAYIERLASARPDADGWLRLDPDTYLSAGSFEAALRAAGAACAALDGVMAGNFDKAFCAVRPPGHHAMPDHAMGFCLLSNAAIAARRALDVHGLERVAIVDFDVHHGNGTQAALWDVPGAFYASVHQADFYPGTGHAHETGAMGEIVNLPMPAGTGSADWRDAVATTILPALEAFAPQCLILSAGFDAHKDDPLARFALTSADFAWITTNLCAIARKTSCGRVVSLLEGGYDLQALGRACAAHIRALEEA